MKNNDLFLGMADEDKAREYFKELVATIIEYETTNNAPMDKTHVSQLKNTLAKKHQLKKPPRDMDVLLTADIKDLDKLKTLKAKPTRSLSGVAVVAVMTAPKRCPHGTCTFCPGGLDSFYGDTPQSYTGFEPSTRRAIRNDYNPFLIVINRLEQYVLTGHNPNKVDCIIMGGTFPSYAKSYKYNFVIRLYAAMNAFSKLFYKDNQLDYKAFRDWFELPHPVDDKEIGQRLKQKMLDLEKECMEKLYAKYDMKDYSGILKEVQKVNETAAIRCIGLTEETKPEYSLLKQGNEMLEHGVTRIEIGVQTTFDDVLIATNRGHGVQECIDATQIMKDLGLKVNHHIMIGMPGNDLARDNDCLHRLFDDPDFKPDMLKIYPCLVMPGTPVYDDYKAGKFKPIELDKAAEMIGDFFPKIPEYCRVMRIQRDIPSTLVEGGVMKTNLKQYVEEHMKKKGLVGKEIRTREIARIHKKKFVEPEYDIKVLEYDASNGKEFFISAEDTANDILLGFCRLRFPYQFLREEITPTSAIIREVHVYGAALQVGESNSSDKNAQHKGWGKKLVAKAEEIAKSAGKDKMLVISGIGVRQYYMEQLGYDYDGPYVSKHL